MAYLRAEQRPTHQRSDDVGQKQVSDRFELVSLGGMSRDANPQFAQVLNGAPHFGARGAQFFGDASSADDQRRVVAEQANDVAEASVGQAFGQRVGAGWG